MKITEDMCMSSPYNVNNVNGDRKANSARHESPREKWLYRLIRFSCVVGETDKVRGHRYNNAIIIRNAYVYRWRLCQSATMHRKYAASCTVRNKTFQVLMDRQLTQDISEEINQFERNMRYCRICTVLLIITKLQE